MYFELSDSCSAFSSSDAAGQLDLAVLDLDVAVLLLEQRRLLLELLVGLLQLLLLCWSSSSDALSDFACSSSSTFDGASSSCRVCSSSRLRLQLLGQRLRLLEQLLGAHVGDDRVEDDADRLHQLVEELLVDLAERAERGELDHRQHLLLEEHRQDDDVDRRRPRRGPDAMLDVVVRRRR